MLLRIWCLIWDMCRNQGWTNQLHQAKTPQEANPHLLGPTPLSAWEEVLEWACLQKHGRSREEFIHCFWICQLRLASIVEQRWPRMPAHFQSSHSPWSFYVLQFLGLFFLQWSPTARQRGNRLSDGVLLWSHHPLSGLDISHWNRWIPWWRHQAFLVWCQVCGGKLRISVICDGTTQRFFLSSHAPDWRHSSFASCSWCSVLATYSWSLAWNRCLH